MTFRDRVMNVYRRQPVDRIPFQPRVETWYYRRLHGLFGGLPEPYKSMESIIGLYDHVGCSVRPYKFYSQCLKLEHSDRCRLTVTENGPLVTRVYSTPVGEVESTTLRQDVGGRITSWFVKKPEDLRVMAYVARDITPSFDMEIYRKWLPVVGDRGEPTTTLPRMSLTRLIIEWMGFENTIFALGEMPGKIGETLREVDEADEAMVRVIAASPLEVVNFGDNMDCNLVSPPMFRKYVLPVYQRRTQVLHAAGKFCTAHFDGSVKTLLPLFKETTLDGIEALTPLPQGDVTLEELKEALGGMILIDGIPMLCFLPNFSMEELELCAKKVIDLFAPNLILGISDEISPICEIERVRFVAQLVERYAPYSHLNRGKSDREDAKARKKE